MQSIPQGAISSGSRSCSAIFIYPFSLSCLLSASA